MRNLNIKRMRTAIPTIYDNLDIGENRINAVVDQVNGMNVADEAINCD